MFLVSLAGVSKGAGRKRERLLEIIRGKRMSRRTRRRWTDTPTGRLTLILGLYLLRWVVWKTALTDGWWSSFATYLQREWILFAFHLQTSLLYAEEGVRHTLIGACAILIHYTPKRNPSQALTRWKIFPHKNWPLLVEVISKKQAEALLTALASHPTLVAQHVRPWAPRVESFAPTPWTIFQLKKYRKNYLNIPPHEDIG
jgi:hypothetical protein